jgi:hypothetical protein
MLMLTSNAAVLGAFLGGSEVVLIGAVLLTLIGAKRLPEMARWLADRQAHDAGKSLGGIYGKPAFEALTPDNQTAEFYDPAIYREAKGNRRDSERSWLRSWTKVLRLLCRAVLNRLKAKR